MKQRLHFFCRTRSFRLSGNNRKLTTHGKHWECWEMLILQSSQPATVITGWTEENQEGTHWGPDKQAACLRKQCSHVDFSPPALPFTRPQSPRSIISALWNLATCSGSSAKTKEELSREKVESGKRHSALEEKTCKFTQTPTGLGSEAGGCPAHEVCSTHGSYGEWFIWIQHGVTPARLLTLTIHLDN